MSALLKAFAEIWLCDFEFIANSGERSDPVCLVAWELRSNRKLRLWRDQFGSTPPYSVGRDSLFVSYFASAELGCHSALGWPMPVNVLDLFTEFRNSTNGQGTIAGNSLLGALIHHGLGSIGVEEKTEMRDLVLRGGPWTRQEQTAILDYCESDVDALARLFPVMFRGIDFPRALYRGRYMTAVAKMEFAGVPIDTELLAKIRANWTEIQDRLITEIDKGYDVYDGRTFKLERFEQWLNRKGFAWPVLESGQLDLSRDTFKDMGKTHSEVLPLHELRHALSELRLNDLAVGKDGRNRCLLSPFRARTSRNAPSNTRHIFGPAVWLRFLIQPPPGWGLAYVDWCQQEFGIAAALSGDANMLAAYETGDPYLAFAKQAHAVPNDATKESHAAARDLFKQCVLGVQYGIGAESLAYRIGQIPFTARHLLNLHREVYGEFWKWSDAVVDQAMLYGRQATVFGWVNRVFPDPNPRSLRNFPMQANGAEMLRLACCLGTENGIEICTPVHDAVLIAAPFGRLEADITRMRGYMEEASSVVLAGFKLSTEYTTVIYPDHYFDRRGEAMFSKVMALL